MNGLQVLRHQVCVSPSHFQRGMPEHFLQVKHAPATAQIVIGERVPKSVTSFVSECQTRGISQWNPNFSRVFRPSRRPISRGYRRSLHQ